MFASLLLAAVAAAAPDQPGTNAPGSRCLTEYGKTACGYDCIARWNDVKCAQTPDGICYAEHEQLVCWDPPVWLRDAYGRAPLPRPRCVSEYGEIVCGYECLARFGKARCARTPDGICFARNDQVTCWDPPPQLRVAHGNAPLPRPKCVEEYGQIACGFQCLARHDQLKCTQTPEGICREEDGQVICWDPPL